MSASFAPSLKHMILAKIAIQICNDPQVRCFVNEVDFLWDKMAGEHRWKDLLDKAAEKISELNLPHQLHQSVLAIIKPIALEIARWKSDHLKVLGDKFDFLSCELYWKPEGIIDREKTAKMLVLNKSLCEVNRFFLACCYCLKNEVQKIWKFMSPAEECRAYNSNFSCVTFWCSWLYRKGVINWTKLAQRLLNERYPSVFFDSNNNPIWLRCFFNKLTPEEKERCIAYTVNNTFKDHDNFQFSVSQLDENQRELVFKESPVRFIRFCLDWPYQSLFSEATEQMWKYLHEGDFKRLLHFIIYYRIMTGWNDFDYVNLMKDFWRRSPKHFKEYIKNDTIFEPVKMVIDHDFLQVFPKKEIAESSYRIDLLSDKYFPLRDAFFYHSY